jgi:subtilisin-like proprotein convertase family protein
MKRILRSSILAISCTAALMGGAEASAGVSVRQSPPSTPPVHLRDLPPRARAQIDALAAAKAARSPAQRKVDSSLLTAAQLHRGHPLPMGVHVRPLVHTDAAGRTTVQVRGRVDKALVARIGDAGGIVKSVSPTAIRADVPLASVESLAAASNVTRISSFSSTPISANMRPRPEPTHAEKVAELKRKIAAGVAGESAVPADAVSATSGAVDSEGDTVHGAKSTRRSRNLSGIGIDIGVLSDGVDSRRQSQSTGDLPGLRILPGQAGFGDEGTAMLEIVHDLAPKAGLLFATASNGEESFADNIRALREAGADIIVDDILYLSESAFQDGPIARAVLDVTRDGALYFSSAGNEGNVADGTSGNYEGTFVSTGASVGKFSGFAHDFDPGAAVQAANPVTDGSAGAPAILQWADPLGAASDDYDLYALDADGNVVGFSNDIQDGNDDPFEGFFLDFVPNTRLAVVKFRGADRYFQLSVLRGRFGAAASGLTPYATPGITRGHSTVPAAFSVAAVPAARPLPFDLEEGDPANPSGPFPNRYPTTQQSERFTSDGPRRVFFRPNGVPPTPGNFSSTGGVVRQKPDFAAADGVSTSVEGFSPFFGTSASAPHAAGIAALVMSGKPGITPSQVRQALTSTARDLETPGRDNDTGFGVLGAGRALTAIDAKAQAYPRPGAPKLVSSTDGDPFLEPGESGRVEIPVINAGDVTASSVVGGLRTTVPGVSFSPIHRNYFTLAPGASLTRSYSITVPRTVRPGATLDLTIDVVHQGDFSPILREARIVIGQPSATAVTGAYTGPPVPIPDADEAGAQVPMTVSGVGPVSSVTFSVDGMNCDANVDSQVGLSHTFVSDLVGTLTGPDGTNAVVFQNSGEHGRNMCHTVFTDAATAPFAGVEAVKQPFTGNWRPAQPFATFAGTQGNGTWTFHVADLAEVDTGSIQRVSVHVKGFVGGS